ncbi:MAG: HAMP domain-containing histidine kinase [Ruminococcaceae bacterium]|nr:HAMP domain-containing histidine kinase [Oscillospiraceae bacterium]
MANMKNAVNKTVFRRFLFYGIIMVLLCLLIITIILIYPVTGYIEQAKKNTLIQHSQEISTYISEISDENPSSAENLVPPYLETLSETLKAEILITDNSGQITFASSQSNKVGTMLPSSLISGIKNGSYFTHDNLDGFYDKAYYIAITPIQTADNETLGYTVVSQYTVWSSDAVPSVFVVFTLVVLLSALLIFALTSVYAFNASRPLKQMTAAAKRFASGDFESRVTVKNKDEIGELASAFNEMADSLASMEGIRRNFVANVSHELKTPMTTISGYIDGILDGTIPKTEQEYYLSIVSEETKRLSRLVTSMISLSKIDSGEIQVNKSTFDIMDVVFSVLQSFESRLSEKELTIEGLDIEENIMFFGDKDLIHQTIYNLVENAVKFTNQKGTIRFYFDKKDGFSSLSIENTGKGILPEDIRYVFDKFYKADKSRSTDKRSMGLGLYICRTVVMLHGGKITADSQPDEYCRFSFTLPDQKRKKLLTSDNREE